MKRTQCESAGTDHSHKSQPLAESTFQAANGRTTCEEQIIIATRQ